MLYASLPVISGPMTKPGKKEARVINTTMAGTVTMTLIDLTPSRKTKFSIASPGDDRSTTSRSIIANNDNYSNRSDENSDELDSPNDEAFEGKAFDLSFKKKDPKRSTTQSFQSVLSTASLKSLKQQAINQQMSNNHSSAVDLNSSKNFQSFIQAPVMSSITNLKGDDVEIGQQLPFNDMRSDDESGSRTSKRNSNETDNSVKRSSNSSGSDYEETVQQNLTINALKKLSLSPIIINNDEYEREPYQPAEVDLSRFASLTRQHKEHPLTESAEQVQVVPNVPPQLSPTKLELVQPTQQAQLDQHTQLPEHPAQVAHVQPQQTPSINLHPQLPLVDDHPKRTLHRLPENESVSNSLIQPIQLDQPNQQLTNQPLSQPTHKFPSNQPTPNHSYTSPNQSNPTPTERYHNEMRYNTQKQSDLPSAVQPPVNMIRRLASNLQQAPPPQSIPLPHFPTSKLHKQLQQIKGLRSPMYVPAVLRKTKNGISPVNSPDSVRSGSYIENNLNSLSQPFDNAQSTSRSLVNSFESSKSVESQALAAPHHYEDLLRAPPTKRHWVKDETVSKCGVLSCLKTFNFFERRHHCRKCGGIYCAEHTSHYLYINHIAQFTTGGRGTLSKVCDLCINDYNKFITQEFGVGVKSDGDTMVNTYGFTPIGRSERSDLVVGTVPANWSWSSF